LEQVRSEYVNNPRVDREVAREVERAVAEARALVQTGRVEQGRERIVDALRTAEQELARTEQRLEVRPAQEVRVSETYVKCETKYNVNQTCNEQLNKSAMKL
ncbi:MAG: hypothetical protein LRY71_13225, partial [Bacillaceae bacterium]|nr:hypothetical protein [Bacillaceae bacterium]